MQNISFVFSHQILSRTLKRKVVHSRTLNTASAAIVPTKNLLTQLLRSILETLTSSVDDRRLIQLHIPLLGISLLQTIHHQQTTGMTVREVTLLRKETNLLKCTAEGEVLHLGDLLAALRPYLLGRMSSERKDVDPKEFIWTTHRWIIDWTPTRLPPQLNTQIEPCLMMYLDSCLHPCRHYKVRA